MDKENIASMKRDFMRIMSLCIMACLLIAAVMLSETSLALIENGFKWSYIINISISLILIVLPVMTLKIIKNRFKPIDTDIKNHDDRMEN